jgi:hypothetical protein
MREARSPLVLLTPASYGGEVGALAAAAHNALPNGCMLID